MGRTSAASDTPLLEPKFFNANNPSKKVGRDGAVYVRRPPSDSLGSFSIVNSLEFPKACELLKNYNEEIGSVSFLGSYEASVSALAPFPRYGSDANYEDKAFAYGVTLAKSATAFNPNKTANFYSEAVEISGRAVGSFNPASGRSYLIYTLGFDANGMVNTLISQARFGEAYGYYFDTANSRHTWLTSGKKVWTTDGTTFNSSAVTGLPSRVYPHSAHFKPLIITNGASTGCVILRTGTSGGFNDYDTFEVYSTTNNFASVSNSSAAWWSLASNAYPCVINFDGTKLCIIYGDTTGQSANMRARVSTDYGVSATASTVAGSTTVFIGMNGFDPGATLGLAGAAIASCNGASASEFMYMSSFNGQYHSYYTANGGTSFATTSLQATLTNALGVGETMDTMCSLTYASGTWIALFFKYNQGYYALKSTNNGVAWSSPAFVASADIGIAPYVVYNLAKVFAVGTKFVAVTQTNQTTRFYKSDDGTVWTEIAQPFNYAASNLNQTASFYEFTDYYVINGRILRKSDLTITGFNYRPLDGEGSSMQFMAYAANKVAAIFRTWIGGIITNTGLTNGDATFVLPTQTSSYSTSGSAYGAFEYWRVK